MITVDPAILIYAFRYALGRLTYAAADARRAIEANLDHLTERDRALITVEIRTAIADERLTLRGERDDWLRLARTIEATLPAALTRSGR